MFSSAFNRSGLVLVTSLTLATSVFGTTEAIADSCTSSKPHGSRTSQVTKANSKTIVDIASKGDSFKTLTAALKAAGLVEVLQGDGPFTVFAPTDEAFAALPEGTVEKLLKPENKDKLVKILTYHVVPGNVTSANLKAGEQKTVEGNPVMIKLGKSSVKVNDAKVIQADVKASNGVIHVIDKVILPPDM